MRLIGERLSVPATSVVAMTRSAIEAEGLVKHFGDTVAVDGVSFSVPEGSVLGLLGPNGAGKTTTVRMMTTLTRPTAGTGRVAARDHAAHARRLRRATGGADLAARPVGGGASARGGAGARRARARSGGGGARAGLRLGRLTGARFGRG